VNEGIYPHFPGKNAVPPRRIEIRMICPFVEWKERFFLDV